MSDKKAIEELESMIRFWGNYLSPKNKYALTHAISALEERIERHGHSVPNINRKENNMIWQTSEFPKQPTCSFCPDDATEELLVFGRKVPVCLRCWALISDIVEFALEEERGEDGMKNEMQTNLKLLMALRGVTVLGLEAELRISHETLRRLMLGKQKSSSDELRRRLEAWAGGGWTFEGLISSVEEPVGR